VRVSDFFEERNTHCLVMDYIPGESLGEMILRGALPETEAVEYIRQVGSALKVVHEAGLVHLDVTPSNIMLQSSGNAVLIDFGIAGDMSPPSSFSRSFGNKAFAPYELFEGVRHPTVDVYTLAASLYYAVTGERPAKSIDRKYYSKKTKFVSPKELVSQISDEVNRAILKGMELEPENRPQSMQEWLKLLEPKQVAPVSTPQPVQPSPQRSGLRNGSSIPRHRLNTKSTWAVGAVVALTLVALAGALVGRQYPFLSSKPQVSPTERNLPTNPNSAATNPTSAVRVDYSKLQNLLAQDKWKEADQETQNVMQKVAGREKDRWLRDEDLEKFPCTDLRTIDTLWVKYSKGRFGFSVQKRIWKSVGGTPDADETYLRLTYLRLSDRIKWHVNNDWLDYNSLTFSVEKAPEGHLPGWGGGKSGWWGSLFSRLETCRV
jgi:serine/threonine-protein kinase